MVRRAAGRFGFRTVLQAVDLSGLHSVDFKMLFLVPAGNGFFRDQVSGGFEFEAMRRMKGAPRQRTNQAHPAN